MVKVFNQSGIGLSLKTEEGGAVERYLNQKDCNQILGSRSNFFFKKQLITWQ